MTRRELAKKALENGLEVLFSFVLPYVVFTLLKGRLGDVGALLASSIPPIFWSIVTFLMNRKIDAIAILVLLGIALSLLAFLGGGGVRALQLRESLVTGLVGLIFLGSAAIGRPIILLLAVAGARRESEEAANKIASRQDDPALRRVMTLATLVWGAGLIATCAICCLLVMVLTIPQFLLVNGPVNYIILGGLAAWTFWYMRRAVRPQT